jgi:PIN domain nuclease of toxin-antitoxin system
MIDTHALLWWAVDAAKLAEPARRSIADPANVVLVSAATIWEIEIKRRAGRLDAPEQILDDVQANGFQVIPMTGVDAVAAASLPLHHKDPFDRMLIAQARRLDAVVVSQDEAFATYDVHVLTA